MPSCRPPPEEPGGLVQGRSLLLHLHNITIDIGGQGWRRGPRHREYGTATYDHGAFDADPDGAVGGFGLHQQPVPRACPSAEAVRERLYEESCPARNYSQDGTRRAGVLRRRD